MENITKSAKKILKNSKVLVDIMIESESTRIMVVNHNGEFYILRFMNDKCYALVDFKQLEKTPLMTHYALENKDKAKYVVKGISGNSVTEIAYSNDLKYVIESCKWHLFSLDKMVVEDNNGTRVADVYKNGEVIYWLPDNALKKIVDVLEVVCKELGIEGSRRTLKLCSMEGKTLLVSWNNYKDISNSKNIFDVDLLVMELENILYSGIECIVFSPAKLEWEYINGYYKDSILEEGNIRIVLG